MTVQSDLLGEIEAFLANRKGMAETTFGRLAVNDGKFVGRLRAGCNMTLATIERTRKFISSQNTAPPPKPSVPAKRSKRAVATPTSPDRDEAA